MHYSQHNNALFFFFKLLLAISSNSKSSTNTAPHCLCAELLLKLVIKTSRLPLVTYSAPELATASGSSANILYISPGSHGFD